jgi:hypothetical protein
MSASQQHHINALLQEQLQLLTQKCEFLANAHTETLERLKKLEAHAANTSTQQSPSSSIPARRLSTATETTIRRSSHEQLSNLVVRLCNRDDAAQKLAVSTLVGGEATSQSMPAPATGASVMVPGPASKRRASRAFSGSMKTCRNCKERFSADEMRDECWFHPGKLVICRFAIETIDSNIFTGRREVDEDADFWDNEPYTDWQGRRMSGFVPFEEGMGMAWTCCGKDGRADGCERGEHEAVEAGSGSSATRKRLRW